MNENEQGFIRLQCLPSMCCALITQASSISVLKRQGRGEKSEKGGEIQNAYSELEEAVTVETVSARRPTTGYFELNFEAHSLSV